MSTMVTLDVFSGRENPTWMLDDKQQEELDGRLRSMTRPTNTRPSGSFGGLGYRGFSLARHASHPAGERYLRLHEGILDQGITMPNLVDDTELEAWLLKTSGHAVPDDVKEHVASATGPRVAAFALPVAAAVKCPTNHAVDAPAYNPGAWNIPTIQPHNNCYNYANDHVTNTFAQPGRATGHGTSIMDCAHVQAGAVSDGLHAVTSFATALPKGKGWYVALVIWPGHDYHWYRQDTVGCWSHKPGSTAARNVDNAGHQIADPKTCNRGPYTVFCSYMVTNRGVHIA